MNDKIITKTNEKKRKHRGKRNKKNVAFYTILLNIKLKIKHQP